MRLLPGKPYPLGATWDGAGVNFALFSENATKVELCLFDRPEDAQPSETIALTERTDGIWHGYSKDVRPGRLYGFRVHGAWEPERGLRFNPHKVLLDPYARAIGRPLRWSDALFAYILGHEAADLSFDERDSAADAPLGAVVDGSFDWGEDASPHVPWHQTLIYELHVKGFTHLHPGVPEASRGTYAALGSQPVIDYLRGLGVTSVELMPVHYAVQDRHLVEKGLSNYWGYNTLGFFAPDPRFSASGDPAGTVREFKTMVRSLHAAGLEVLLDVVYNHTGEGNHLGPSLSLRGIDNGSYYRLEDDQPRHYRDYTGCGNTFNMRQPCVLQMIMDSLRYWVTEMHVDGFRFDLAPSLARELHEVNKLGAFFDIIHQDPVLSRVKLIAEPWDMGEGGYQIGNFPFGWAEWNAKYRDTVRRFWKGEGGSTSELATRITGSSDLYESTGRRPYASINFIAAHDGFTLNDLVSYDQKHNEANGEENRDGDSNNVSWNCGAEGPVEDGGILALRERQRRNFVATLLLSQGVPMLGQGDESGRTQRGNNNAYCQDNALSWVSWELSPAQADLLEFTRTVVRLWKENPVFQRRRFFLGRPIRGQGIQDIRWIHPEGREMSDAEWQAGQGCLGMSLNGQALEDRNDEGERIVGDSFLVLLNAGSEAVPFTLPPAADGFAWGRAIDTWQSGDAPGKMRGGEKYPLRERSLAVLRLEKTA